MTKTKKIACVLTLAIAMCFTIICLSGSTSVSVMAAESSSTTSASTSSSSSSTTSSATETRTSSITLYDGSTDSKQMATATQNDIVMMLKGFSNSPKTLTGVTANDKEYSYATPTGGKSSSSRSIQLIVPDNYHSFTVYMVATTNSSSAVNVGISETAEYAATDTKILTTGTDSDVYAFGTSASLEPGTYYITFDNSLRIAELTVNVKTIVGNTNTSTSVEETDSSLIIGNKVTPMTYERKLRIIIGCVSGVAIVLVLIILICNRKKKCRCKKIYRDFDDDDYDDFYDEY